MSSFSLKRVLCVSASGLALAATSQTAAAQSSNVIEELVVTAEKREQSLQDVPVAVSAFSAAKRDLIGINTIQDITNFTPGLQYNSSTDRVSLRGVGRLTNVLSADAAVANYSDGIYETFAVRAGASTMYIDRVEVLRGAAGNPLRPELHRRGPEHHLQAALQGGRRGGPLRGGQLWRHKP